MMEISLLVSVFSVVIAMVSASSAIFGARASYSSACTSAAALALNTSTVEANRAGSERSAELTTKMFLRQGVIDLHMAWQGVSDVHPDACIVPDVVRTIGALTLTATLWNHEIVDKIILYQNYWTMCDTLFNRFNNWDKLIPILRVSGKSLITREVRKMHEEMRTCDLGKVDQSRLQSGE